MNPYINAKYLGRFYEPFLMVTLLPAAVMSYVELYHYLYQIFMLWKVSEDD
jgi:hypothetical protein